MLPASAQIVSRKREPVVIRATDQLFPDFVDDNFDASSFELWRSKYGTWEIIPFQIDEVSADPRRIIDLSYSARQCSSTTDFPSGAMAGPCEFEYVLRGAAQPSLKLTKNDEIIFMAGAVGECGAAWSSWPSADLASTRYKIILSDYSPSGNSGESGCVYLFRRTAGSRPAMTDLVEYDTAGDGTSHAGGCVPTSAACGALEAVAADVDLDGTTDVPAWRWDFLGNWAVDKWFIGETTVDASQNTVDLIKYRITNPAETEGNWDLRSGFNLGCSSFYGYIDGPVRVVRKIGGAASGVLTTKYEFAYPGEVKTVINARVHTVGGSIYTYPDLLQANVSAGTNAKVFKSGSTGTPFDVVDGAQPSGSFGFQEWYQVSSDKGSFLRIDGPHRHPTVMAMAGAYNDQTTPLWTDVSDAVEYDIDEVGDRAAGRSTFTDICDTQSFFNCAADKPYPGTTFDPLLMTLEASYVMLSSGSASSTSGSDLIARRSRGEIEVAAVKETQGGTSPGSPVFCIPTIQSTYSNDGGPVDLSAAFSGCSNIGGWSVYMSAGAGTYRRLGSLPLTASFRDVYLGLNEQRTYYAAAVGNDGSHGPLSQGLVFSHNDTTAPSAPTGVAATVSAGKITVSWTLPGDPDVEKFKIYAAMSSGGTPALIDSGANSHCAGTRTVDAAPGTYYLTVKAVDFAGNHSAASAQVQVIAP